MAAGNEKVENVEELESQETLETLQICARQADLLTVCRQGLARYILASGPRWCAKTLGCLVAVCDHAWETSGASIAVIVVSQSVGQESGVWEDLIGNILPRWMAQHPGGMKWVRRPYVSATTKIPTCIVSNKHGTRSTIRLLSLKHEREVEERFKPRRFSMIYVPELSTFKQRMTFNIWTQCLRVPHLLNQEAVDHRHHHLFLADTNPAEEGERSWIYQLWYTLRLRDALNDDEKSMQDRLALLEFRLDDNIFISEEQKRSIRSDHAHDPDLYARNVEGKWTGVRTNALFSDVFRPTVHLVGDIATPADPNPVTLIPEENCAELQTGLDIGRLINNAAVIGETYYRMATLRVGGKEVQVAQACLKQLDEVVSLGRAMRLSEFIEMVLARMDFWESIIGRPVQWRHWSDRSAFDMRESDSLRRQAEEIVELSGGRITPVAAGRGPGSVGSGIELMRRLLFEDRIRISKDRCPHTIRMYQQLRRGSGGSAIDEGSEHKHVADAVRYWTTMQCYDELRRPVRQVNEGQTQLVMVHL